MATTTPSHDRVDTRTPPEVVPVPPPVPAQRTAPASRGGRHQAVGTTTLRPSLSLPRLRPPAVAPKAYAPTPTARTSTAPAAVAVLPPRPAPAPAVGPVPQERWSASWGELTAMITIAVVATVGGVCVLAATAVPDPAPVLPPASVSPNVSVPGRVLTAVDDGVWQVGVDVEPGTYSTTGPVRGATCRHALRLARTGGDVTTATASVGPAAVILTPGDGWFATSGCATWRRVG